MGVGVLVVVVGGVVETSRSVLLGVFVTLAMLEQELGQFSPGLHFVSCIPTQAWPLGQCGRPLPHFLGFCCDGSYRKHVKTEEVVSGSMYLVRTRVLRFWSCKSNGQ